MLSKSYTHDKLYFIIIFFIYLIFTLSVLLFFSLKQGYTPDYGFNLEFKYYNDYKIHIHHWMYMLPFAIIIYFIHFDKQYIHWKYIINGSLIGASFSDLVYDDFCEILIKN